jgi:LysM repeat protein
MIKRIAFLIALLLLISASGRAQDGYTERAKKYIDQYATLAILEQQKSGVPASITLGQGILETEAGASELMTQANNHFGIKCKNGWQGETFTHTDDAPDECFKKYKCAEESFHDHSEHLKRNPRYAPLFKIKQTDYAGWAKCLKKCGYATNPQYAQRLIKIIEDFKLQDYTYTALDSSLLNNYAATHSINASDSEDVDDTVIAPPVVVKHDAPKPATTIDTPKVVVKTPAPEPTQPKIDTPVVPVRRTHVVLEGENIFRVAQAEYIPIKTIRQLNMLAPNEEPIAGTVLQLEVMATQKPTVRVNATVAHTGNAIVTHDDKNPGGNDYIAIDKSKNKPHTDSPRATRPTRTLAGKPVAPPPPIPSKLDNIKKENTPKAVVVKPNEDEEYDRKEREQQELNKLKNELDQVVYADDSKLIAEYTPPPLVSAPRKPLVETPIAKTGKTYTVKKGDTAFSIAKRNNITVDQLMEWNNIKATDIKVGKVLRVKE